MTTAIIGLGILYFVGHLLVHVFERTRVPDVLILIGFGILIGPVLGWLHPSDIGPAGDLLTTVALIVILFESGLEMDIRSLRDSANRAIKLTTITFFISAGIVTLVMYGLFGFSIMASLVTGFICGGTSSAVVIPMVNSLDVGKESTTMLVLESALTDVLCIVFALGVLDSVETGEFEIGKILGNLIASLLFALIIGVLLGIVWVRLLALIRGWQHTQFATFAFMFLVYGLTDMLGFSGPIAALAFGIFLGNYRLISPLLDKIWPRLSKITITAITPAEHEVYKEIVFMMKLFFFVYLGMSFSFSSSFPAEVAIVIVVALYLARPLITKALVSRHVSAYDSTIVSVMIPKGLAAAVLAGLPAQYGMVEGPDIQAVVFHIVLISIILTSVLVTLIEKTGLRGAYEKFFGGK